MEIIDNVYENADSVDKYILSRIDENLEIDRGTARKLKNGYVELFLKREEEECSSKRKNLIFKLVDLKKNPYTKADYTRAKIAMDNSHEGLEYLKSALLNEVSSAIVMNKTPRPILLVGSPGSGKTSLCVSLAKGLRKSYDIISLSGMAGTFMLKGNDPQWKGATEGKIINAFVKTESLSPIIIFDELDKLGDSTGYGKAADAFLDLLEDDRKKEFVDDFLSLPFDCSSAWTIFTANTLEGIPEPLLDRLRIIEMKRYELSDLEKITKRLIEKMNYTIGPSRYIEFDDEAVKALAIKKGMHNYSVRPIRDAVEKIFAIKSSTFLKDGRIHALRVDAKTIEDTLKEDDINIIERKEEYFDPGMINGIAVSGTLAYLSPVEVKIVKGRSGLSVYGLCEKMTNENACIAYELADSYIRRNYGEMLEETSINYIASIRRNGDSAGLATALAILSEYTSTPVREDIAVTGAITMKGIVLPVGGVVTKLQGMFSCGIKDVIIPEANRKEAHEVEKFFKNKMKIHYVSTFEEAVSIIFPAMEKKMSMSR